MQIERENIDNPYVIKRYEKGLVEVNSKEYSKPIIISATSVTSWEIDTLEDVNLDVFLKEKPDILLIGTGTQAKFLAAPLLLELQKNNIGVETMNSAAACRTFNLLLGEDRKVLAAIIP